MGAVHVERVPWAMEGRQTMSDRDKLVRREPLTFWETAWAVAFGQILAGVLLIAICLSVLMLLGMLGGVVHVLERAGPVPTEPVKSREQRMKDEEDDRRIKRLIEEYGDGGGP